MNREEIVHILETLRECWAELEAMESTYKDYCVAGHLEDHVETAIEALEAALDFLDK